MAERARAQAQDDREELVGRRIALLSMSVGVVLATAKIIVGVHVGSTSLVSDGCEAAADVLSSAFVFAGLLLASRPPDQEHPYGHGRYETVAGLAVGALLLLSGAAILWNAFLRFDENNKLQIYALYPLLAAFVLKIALAGTKFRVGKRIDSSALTADGWHDITDLLSTSVAFIAIGLSLLGPARFRMADHIGGIFIGLIIVFLSVRVVVQTVGQLIDTMPEPSKMAELRSVALSVPGTLGIEKCFARRTGLKYHVDLHLEVDPDLTVRESHEIARLVKRQIKQELRWVADVLIHVEPAETAATEERRALERVRGE
jgi:cation diffusion facilitator family transporter